MDLAILTLSSTAMVSTRGGATTTPKKTQPSTPKRQSSAKKKNFVKAAKPLRSPDFRVPQSSRTKKSAATAEEDDNDSDNISETSSTTNRSKLPLHIQKQLAQDIEEAGGIRSFRSDKTKSLLQICNKQTDIYGKSGEETRKRIQKKFYWWQQLDLQDLYASKVLNRLQVKSFETIKTEKREQARQAGTCEESELSSSAGSGSESESSRSSSSSSSDSSTAAFPKIAKKIPRREIPTKIKTLKNGKVRSSKEPAIPPPPQKMSSRSPRKPLPMGIGKFFNAMFVVLHNRLLTT